MPPPRHCCRRRSQATLLPRTSTFSSRSAEEVDFPNGTPTFAACVPTYLERCDAPLWLTVPLLGCAASAALRDGKFSGSGQSALCRLWGNHPIHTLAASWQSALPVGH